MVWFFGCGGTILTANAILTAAHCGIQPGYTFATGLYKRDEESPEDRGTVGKVIYHPRESLT